MKLYYLTSGPLRVNSYFLVNEQENTAILIDCGENYKLIKQTEERLNIKIKALLLTHAHFDHAGCASKLQKDGVKVYVSKKDSKKLLNDENLGINFGRKFEYLTADYTFDGGDTLTIEGMEIKVIETPGHTDGSVTFLVQDMLFTGDTLFLESVGRTDFISGNRIELLNSVKKLFALTGDYKVYPGHEEFTTLSHERKYNILKDYD